MRFIRICALCFVAGCGADDSAPVQIAPEQRETIRQNLSRLGAQVTADAPEGLYLSLRNTHVEIRELGGVVEGSRRTRNDVVDFCSVNEALAKSFMDVGDFEAFRRWLRQSLSPRADSVPRAEYGDLKLTLSRAPLRSIFSRKKSSVPE